MPTASFAVAPAAILFAHLPVCGMPACIDAGILIVVEPTVFARGAGQFRAHGSRERDEHEQRYKREHQSKPGQRTLLPSHCESPAFYTFSKAGCGRRCENYFSRRAVQQHSLAAAEVGSDFPGALAQNAVSGSTGQSTVPEISRKFDRL
jgi:hypothetical protein